MYNFKYVDYRRSNQNYIFSLVGIKEESDYYFRYIPYSLHPSLLMMQYLVGERESVFNADIYNYMRIALSDTNERCGEKEILLLSDSMSKKGAYLNKLGGYSKDINPSYLFDMAIEGRKDLIYSDLLNKLVKGRKDLKTTSTLKGSIQSEEDYHLTDSIKQIVAVNDLKGVAKDIPFSLTKDAISSYIFSEDIFYREQLNEAVKLYIKNSSKLSKETILEHVKGSNKLNKGTVVDYIGCLDRPNEVAGVKEEKITALKDKIYAELSNMKEGTIPAEVLATISESSEAFRDFLYALMSSLDAGDTLNEVWAIKDEGSTSVKIPVYTSFSSMKEGSIVDEIKGKITESIGVAEKESTLVILSDMIEGSLDDERPGVIEYVVDALFPRKKLLKFWNSAGLREKRLLLDKDYTFSAKKIVWKSLIKAETNSAKREKDISLNKELNNNTGLIEFDKKLGLEGLYRSEIEFEKMLLQDRALKQSDRWIEVPANQLPISSIETLKEGLDAIEIKEVVLNGIIDEERKSSIDFKQFTGDIYREAQVEEETEGQGLLYSYNDILEDGMDVEHWKEGYAIPEEYDPKDPFNPYYPYAEEQNNYSLIQEDSWDIKGSVTLVKENATLKTTGEGAAVSKVHRNDFKFDFNLTLGTNPDSRSGFIFKHIDDSNYYKFTLSTGNVPMQLIQVIRGRERVVAVPIAPFYLDAGATYLISVAYISNHLNIKVDGRLEYDLVLER